LNIHHSKYRFHIVALLFSIFLSYPAHSDWVSFENVDAITDEGRIGASTTAISSSGTSKPHFYVLCDNGDTLGAYISNAGYFSGDTFKVDWRIDKNPPQNENWSGLQSRDGAWNNQPTEMLPELIKGNSLVVRMHRNYAEYVTAKFSLAGFSRATAQAFKSCDYSPEKEQQRIAERKANIAKEASARQRRLAEEASSKAQYVTNLRNTFTPGQQIHYRSQFLVFKQLDRDHFVKSCADGELETLPEHCIHLIFTNTGDNGRRAYTFDELRNGGYTTPP